MEISVNLKARFCKENNIPINIFQEPYFMERMVLYDKFYGTLSKWNIFIKELENYKTEQDYFADYNRIKDAAINDIKSTKDYIAFNNEDMNKFVIKYNVRAENIYNTSNNGKVFISIDMKHANFSSLKYYSDDIFKAETWEEFISRYTDNKHIINSKYIRQVILGNCNCSRHITYEKHLMDTLLEILEFITKHEVYSDNKLVSLSNDEIVYDVTEMKEDVRNIFMRDISNLVSKLMISFKVNMFTLFKFDNIDGYYRVFNDKHIDFKCVNNLYLPFIIRYFNNEEVTENDKVFYHNGLLAKFIEEPEIKILKN